MANDIKTPLDLKEEIHLRVLRLLENNSQVNQRELSDQLGVSLGKVNYCIKALLERGLIKIDNFRNSQNRLAYMYFLTPIGITEKALLTRRYLEIKLAEYEALKDEIDVLAKEVDAIDILRESEAHDRS